MTQSRKPSAKRLRPTPGHVEAGRRSASTDEKVVDELLKQSTNPAAKRAFDKRLAQIAADSPGIMRSNPRRRA